MKNNQFAGGTITTAQTEPEQSLPLSGSTTDSKSDSKSEIKSVIQSLFAKAERKKQLEIELAEINRELAEYGLTDSLPSTGSTPPAEIRQRKPRQSYPDCTYETVKAFLSSVGGKAKFGDLTNHFGMNKWNAFRKDSGNLKKFKLDKDGVTKYLELK